MQILITHDQCYCSFGDGIIYEFVYQKSEPFVSRCKKCSFRGHDSIIEHSEECFAVHCQESFRKDKKDGFWQISQNVDYQAFLKMLENGG